jgi:hypothetical protein
MKAFGIAGAATALLMTQLASIPLFIWYTRVLLKVTAVELGKAMAPAAGISVGLSVMMLGTKLATRMHLTDLLVIAITAGLVYLSCSFLLWRRFGAGPMAALAHATGDRT